MEAKKKRVKQVLKVNHSYDDHREIYKQLSAPFPEHCIERTSKNVTRKGYDTAGVKAIYVQERINQVLGYGSSRQMPTFTVMDSEKANAWDRYRVCCDIVLQLGYFDNGTFIPHAEATAVGGHRARDLEDAKKGAQTNAFKKAAAQFGIGQDAWKGILNTPPVDDDNPAVPEEFRLGSKSQDRQKNTQRAEKNNGGKFNKNTDFFAKQF